MKVMTAAVLALLAALAAPVLVLLLLVPLLVGGAGAASPEEVPSVEGRSDIPPTLLPLYVEAATRCGMPWTVLAAIGKVESDHDRSTAPGVHAGANYAGASGPMQFLASTWQAYGLDGDGDGVADVYDPADAIVGAANYLCANGASDPAQLRSAIWHYNHDDTYVAHVLEIADRYAGVNAAVHQSSGVDTVPLGTTVAGP